MHSTELALDYSFRSASLQKQCLAEVAAWNLFTKGWFHRPTPA